MGNRDCSNEQYTSIVIDKQLASNRLVRIIDRIALNINTSKLHPWVFQKVDVVPPQYQCFTLYCNEMGPLS